MTINVTATQDLVTNTWFKLKNRVKEYVLIVVGCLVLSVGYIVLYPPHFTATCTLFTRNIDFINDQNLLGSSILALTGLSTQTPIERFQMTMFSRQVARAMIEKDHIDKLVFRKQWDPQTRTWHQASGPVSWLAGSMRSLFGLPRFAPPDDQVLLNYLNKNVDQNVSPVDGTLDLSYDNADPEVARAVLRSLYRQTSNVMKDDSQRVLEHIFKTMNDNLGRSQNVLLQNSIANLVSQNLVEISKAQVADVEVGYLSDVYVAPIQTSPNPIIAFIAAFVLAGLLIGGWHALDLLKWMKKSALPNMDG